MSSFNSLFKWVVLFLVICATIWLSFFYIVGRYEPDTRIKQVGFIEEIKTKNDKRRMELFYVNKRLPYKSQFMELFQIQTQILKQDECRNQQKNLVLILGINTKSVGDKYANLFKYMKASEQKHKCKNPKIFVLKQIKPLILNRQEKLKIYISQISDAINLLTQLISNQKKLSILTYEEGSLLLLSYFTNTDFSPLFRISMTKLDKIVLINTFNPLIKIHQNSAFMYVQRLKQLILKSPQRLQLFNSLNFIMISTLKKCLYYQDYYHQFIFNSNLQVEKTQMINDKILNQSIDAEFAQKNFLPSQVVQTQRFRLHNTLSISTREIFNLHTTISQKNYFIFEPFIKIIGNFFYQNSLRNISIKGVQFYFRYGETFSKYPFQITDKMDVNLCTTFKWTTSQPTLWVHRDPCFKISITAKFRESAFVIYTKQGNFGIYDLNLNKLKAFDNIGGQKIYLIQKLRQEILILNPQKLDIHISASKIFSPRYPLTQIMSEFDIFYLSQLGHKAQKNMNYFPVRTCSNNLLLFPIHFSAGNLKRNPLLQNSDKSCYQDMATFQNLIQYYLINWNLIRNLMIFTLFISHWRKKSVLHSFCYQLVANYILSYENSTRKSQLLTLNLIALCMVVVIQQFFSIVTFLCKFIQIQRKRTFACLVLIFSVCLTCEHFQFLNYNYWKMMLLFVIFFIKNQNIKVFAIKIHFLSEYIVYGISSFIQVIQIILYLQATSTQSIKIQPIKYDSNLTFKEIHNYSEMKRKAKMIKHIQNGVQIVSAVLIGYHLQGDGVQIETIISMYIRIIIILKTFEHKF